MEAQRCLTLRAALCFVLFYGPGGPGVTGFRVTQRDDRAPTGYVRAPRGG
jgi:hypothetical protein